MVMTKGISPTARLQTNYNDIIRNTLVKELKLSNIYQAPRLVKINVGVGLGKSKEDKKAFEVATNTLRKITGQQPILTASKKSIASFKLREGQPIGLKVTLRGERMYEFLDRIINVVLPRLRDFHGVSNKSFDKQGNFNIGFEDQSIFPELSFEETSYAHGLQITLVIKTDDPSHSKELLKAFGLPFMKEEIK